MSYLGLAFERIQTAHDEVESIARAQRSAMGWNCMLKKRRRVIAELERERQAMEDMLSAEVVELLSLLGMLSDDGQVQCHDDRLRTALANIAGRHGER